jgi:putative tryptophan/tyrosine transport system substrate-binding protein
MKRRGFLLRLGAAAFAAAPLAADAQPPKRVGVILQGGPYYAGIEGLREGLKASGLEEGRDLTFVVRDAKGELAAVEAAARELERDGADLIVAIASSVAFATKHATTGVPIVFAVASDPVTLGLVESIPRPGGRLTGVYSINTDLTAKRFEILRELVPAARRVLTFYNPHNPSAVISVQLGREAARTLGMELVERQVTSTDELAANLDALRTVDAYFFVSDALVNSHDTLVVEAATALRVPTISSWVDSRGALAGYGISYRASGRRAASYVARILGGTDPRDLPVEAFNRPTLALNLKTAKALGIAVPLTLQAQADEVIE